MAEPTYACPVCSTPDAAPVWPGEWRGEFHLCRCRACDLAFTVPHLTDEQVSPYYPTQYYGERHQVFRPWIENLMRRFRRRRAQRLTRLVPPGRVLDIGCGRGLTLATLRELGWQTSGVERGESAARYAQEVLGLDVDISGFDAAKYPDNHFDAIILWHVLEHLEDLRNVLDGLPRILRPGGVLVVAVPNSDSWQARVTHYAWFHLDLPRHYWHFSTAWLRKAFSDRGLRIAAEHHVSLEQNPYGWIQSLLNRCGLRHNLLYDVIRRGPARVVPQPWRTYPVQSLLSVLGLFMLLPVAGVLTLLEAACGAGGTIDLYAVKDGSPTARDDA